MLTVDQIRHTVAAYFKDKPVEKVWLFGSYARGEAKEESDVDLLVRYDDSKGTVGLFDILRMKLGLEAAVNKEVQLVEEGRVYHRFQPQIERDLIPVYEV